MTKEAPYSLGGSPLRTPVLGGDPQTPLHRDKEIHKKGLEYRVTI